VNANGDRGITAISLTANNPELKSIVKKNNVKHAIALMSAITKTCPYVDVGKNGFTYVFVVGRDGRIFWRGNQTVKEKDFLKAVGKALETKTIPAFERTLDPVLDDAVSMYNDFRFSESRKAGQKIFDKHSRRSGGDSAGIAEDAAFLIEQIDDFSEKLFLRMELAVETKAGIPFVESLDMLTTGFAKSDAAEKARELTRKAGEDSRFASEIKAARAWLDLVKKRPVIFSESGNRASRAFAKKLRKFIKSYGGLTAAVEAEKLLKRAGGRG